MSDLLLARAGALDGTFTWSDATATGVRSDELRRLLRRRVVQQVAPRAYVVSTTLATAATPEERHRLTTLAVVRSFDGRVAASHHSALAVHGLPFWQVDGSTVHVSRIRGTTSRRRDGLCVHEAYGDDATSAVEPGRVLAVTPALAVIGTAMTSGEVAGVVAADAALHRGVTTRAELDDWLSRLARRPGLAAARRAVAAADHRSESVGETRTRLVLTAMPDLPPLSVQHEFRDEYGVVWARPDFLVGDHVVVEFDGRVKYRAGSGPGGSSPEDVVWAEKLREDRLRSEGAIVVRVIWADLGRPLLIQARVRAAVRDAERLHGHPVAPVTARTA